MSLEDVGASDGVSGMGLCAKVTPVLSVSCAEGMGIVVGALSGMSVFVEDEVVGFVGSDAVELGSA